MTFPERRLTRLISRLRAVMWWKLVDSLNLCKGRRVLPELFVEVEGLGFIFSGPQVAQIFLRDF
jgi:hypothetical protein